MSKKRDELERAFDTRWRQLGGPNLEPEYRFALALIGPGKNLRSRLKAAGLKDWRIDRADPAAKVAIEVDGGTFINGRHSRSVGYSEDCIKLNSLAAHGWLVFRLTTDMLDSDPFGHLTPIIATIKARQRISPLPKPSPKVYALA